jgi:hypothetical protein
MRRVADVRQGEVQECPGTYFYLSSPVTYLILRVLCRPRMMTLDDLKKKTDADDNDGDQTFFAGGEKS